MIRFAGAIMFLFLLGWPRDSFGQGASKTICFGEIGCVKLDPGGCQNCLDERALEKLGCQPLAAIRGRILYEYGSCSPESFVDARQLFKQTCSNTTKEGTNFDKVRDWKPIKIIQKIERMKYCVE